METSVPNRAFFFGGFSSLHATEQFSAFALKYLKRRQNTSFPTTLVGTRHPPLSSIFQPTSAAMPLVRGKWTTVDMDEIRLCQDLVDELELEYVNEDSTTIISTTPEKIFQNTTIALWARTYLGKKEINLGLPALKTWLGNLALCGPGRSGMYEGVTYKFVKREFLHLFSEERWLIILTGWPKNETTTPGYELDF